MSEPKSPCAIERRPGRVLAQAGGGDIARADPAALRRKAGDCQLLAAGTGQKELRRMLEDLARAWAEAASIIEGSGPPPLRTREDSIC